MSNHLSIKTTADGSHTLHAEILDEDYHSIHGAITESMHVFIHAGLNECIPKRLRILEMGFGTGLNALLTRRVSLLSASTIDYVTIELFPVNHEIYHLLNYTNGMEGTEVAFFTWLHESAWNTPQSYDRFFSLNKIEGDINKVYLPGNFDLVYYDAFSPDKQPELWSTDLFLRLFNTMNKGGILVTYCAKGQVRRNLQSAGFKTERLPGSPGKREMLRARKE
jgi:tRNA U34 5-methylaminomethyl-2-thiouridine-forming methyltransferase MnmC